jgi:hypothetical protein
MPVVVPLSLRSQLPQAITVSKSDFSALLAVEVVGWFLRKEGILDRSWLLVVSGDMQGKLASGIMIREPKACNVVFAVSDLGASAEDMQTLLKTASDVIIPSMKTMDSLPEVAWVL